MLTLENLRLKLGPNDYCFNLQAHSNQVTAILGKSGSGKSTLLNLIAGFLKPDSGSIHWEKQSLTNLKPNERPVTTLFQQNNLFGHLSVEQNVGLGVNPNLKLTAADKQDIHDAIKEVGLGSHKDNLASTLSGGEQQRAALARCLLRQQPILLLDEPYGALDEHTRHEMLQLTQQVIRNHSLCVLLVTHNQEDADKLNAIRLSLENGELTAAQSL